MTMWVFDEVKCIHGIDEDEKCEQCIDLLQIEDGEAFLRRIGMGVV